MDNLTKLENKVEDLNDKVDQIYKSVNDFHLEMRVWRGEQFQICKNHREQTEILEKDINGNGKPGIKSQIDDLEKQNITYDSVLQIQKWILGIVTPAIVGLIVYGVYFVITHPANLIK